MEYSAVGAMLLMSLLVGVYYTFFNKQKTFVDSMMSGKIMGRFPITMSHVARACCSLARTRIYSIPAITNHTALDNVRKTRVTLMALIDNIRKSIGRNRTDLCPDYSKILLLYFGTPTFSRDKSAFTTDELAFHCVYSLVDSLESDVSDREIYLLKMFGDNNHDPVICVCQTSSGRNSLFRPSHMEFYNRGPRIEP
ncbi:hypothetical protein J6590_025246 [Homalodisca vitripennis]|nr:hypothetical protein J6590_025246 [Homalodisca vitripennis]